MIKTLPALRYQSVSAIVLMLCLAYPAHATDDLSARAEMNVRAGTERSILMTEFWAPFSQQSDRVLYGDLRLMGDNDENKEGNLGFGYRQIAPQFNSVLGGNIWIDRRHTENGNNFHQLTFGVESLGDKIDLRANTYLQLNRTKTTKTPNIGKTTPYLAGSGIFIDTTGSIVEEPQDGFDAEVGYRLPVLLKHIDTTRVYVGGYHFFGDITDNVTGYRIRGEAQVNSIFSVGARFQHDNPRGSQGFLEATLRFPFKSKKLFQNHGLRSRLDESPERDIDIVTGAKVDSGLMKPVLNSSGVQQRILYVDNTNTLAGDGTKDNPFNTLAAAQAALQANDILYINRGDGTTAGMDQGIVINKANVQVIGSGSALTYGGYTLLADGIAPVITNINAPINANDIYTGNGILVTADKALIMGVTVSGASFFGISGLANNGAQWESFTVKNVTAVNNSGSGLTIYSLNGSRVGNIVFEDNISAGNTAIVSGGNGIVIATTSSAASSAGSVGNITIRNNISNNNSGNGIYVGGISDSDIFVENNTVTAPSSTAANGITIGSFASNAQIKNLIVSGNTVSGYKGVTDTGQGGIILNSAYQGVIDNLTISQNNISDSGRALVVSLGNGINTQIHAVVENNTIHNNIYYGILSSNMSDLTFSDNLISGGAQGLYFRATSGESNVLINGNRVSGTSSGGVTLNATGSGILLAKLEYNTVTGVGSGSSGYGVNIDNDSTGIFNVDLGGGGDSAGNNRIFGNIYRDIFVDSRAGTGGSTPGTTISAKYNWWGVNTGLNQATRATFDNGSASPGSSIDASNFLTVDPGI